MDVFGIICGMLFWGPVILAWSIYLRKGKPPKAVRYIGNGLFLAFFALILYGFGHMMIEDSLFQAAFDGNTASVESLLGMGVNINCEQEDLHFTPLMCAASNGHADTVKALLRHHPDLNHKGVRGTALEMASERNDSEIVRLLKAAGARE